MKAVLVIDMPKDCEHCDLMANFTEDCARCSVTYIPIREGMAKRFCPLRPLPEIKYISPNDTHDDLMFQMGWNACLDEITGETDESNSNN